MHCALNSLSAVTALVAWICIVNINASPIGSALGNVPAEVSSEIRIKSAVLPPVHPQGTSQPSQRENCSEVERLEKPLVPMKSMPWHSFRANATVAQVCLCGSAMIQSATIPPTFAKIKGTIYGSNAAAQRANQCITTTVRR